MLQLPVYGLQWAKCSHKSTVLDHVLVAVHVPAHVSQKCVYMSRHPELADAFEISVYCGSTR